MSFGAGMGAGIGCGIAIGIASGQKRAVEKLRRHLSEQGMTIHDKTGKEVDVATVTEQAFAASTFAGSGRLIAALLVLLLTGVAAFAAVLYFVMQ